MKVSEEEENFWAPFDCTSSQQSSRYSARSTPPTSLNPCSPRTHLTHVSHFIVLPDNRGFLSSCCASLPVVPLVLTIVLWCKQPLVISSVVIQNNFLYLCFAFSLLPLSHYSRSILRALQLLGNLVCTHILLSLPPFYSPHYRKFYRIGFT
jgi:hypothetical protein